MKVYIGTGGYSNEDWLGLLYPEGTKSADFLEVYSHAFDTVELNAGTQAARASETPVS